MTTDKSCPDPKVLEHLLLGRVPAEDAVDLEDHLADCERCAERAGEIHSEDELIVAMQAKQLPPEDDGRVSELIERLRDVNAEAETSRLADTLPGTANRSAAALAELTKLLDAPQEDDELGRIGQYRVLDVLGAGGMGLVLRAEDPHLKRIVAIKVMKGDVAADESAKSRFLREAQATAAIEHDNIVTIYQVAEHRGLPYYAMQFLRGESLDDRLKREGSLDQTEVLRIGREIAEGLAAAHAEGLLHRDIKPDNIWLEEKSGRAKIVDFGLARDTKDDENMTLTGMVLGTPRYMAPEQALGQSVDQRCDLFSLGSVMYHLATGLPPFKADNLAATLMAVVNKSPQPISEFQPEIDDELSRLIERLLAKEPASRFQSAVEVVEAIRQDELRLEDDRPREQTEKRSEPTFGELLLQRQRRRRIVICSALGALSLAIVLGVIFYIQTQTGTVRVEVNDDNLEVLIDETKLTLTDKAWKGRKKAAKHRLAIKLGDHKLNIGESKVFKVDGRDVEHQLAVKLNGFDITSNEFEVVRGDETVLTIFYERRVATLSSHIDANAPPLAKAPFNAEQARRHQQAWADYLGLPVEKEVELPGGEKMSFMLIPPGEFMMGSTDEEQAKLLEEAQAANDARAIDHIPSEGPQHRVRITRAFYLGKYEVTQTQWQAVMGNGPSQIEDSPTDRVAQVSWDHIQLYREKLHECVSAGPMKFALPTEAQWEYACRAGTTSSWYGGNSENDLRQYGWFDVNSDDKTHPTGRLKANAFGLYDLHGNVWEWCADWYSADYYANSPVDNPTGPSAGSDRVGRGGAWLTHSRSCRSAYRAYHTPKNRGHNLGFRLAMTIDTAKLDTAKLDSAPPPSAVIDSLEREPITPEDGWIDIMPALDVTQHGLAGTWRIVDGELVGIYGLGLPVIPLGNYEWEIEFTPALGSGPLLNFTFPHEYGRAYVAVCDKPGIHDWHPAGSKKVTRVIKAAPPVSRGEKHLLKIALVTQDDTMSIAATIDGQPWAEWSGETKSLASDSLGSRCPAVWSSSQLTIHASRLRMLSGEASWHDDVFPEGLEELATGIWIPLLTSREDLEATPGTEVKWADGVLELLARDGFGAAQVPSAPRGQRMILRAEVNRLEGSAMLLFDRSDGRRRVQLQSNENAYVLFNSFSRESGVNEYRRSSETSGFEDLAIAIVGSNVAAYLNGERILVATGFAGEAAERTPLLRVDSGRAQFRNVRVMVLDDAPNEEPDAAGGEAPATSAS